MLLVAWGSAHLQAEPEVRTVLFASGTILSYILSAFAPLGAYPASEAPNWRIGAKLYLGFAVVSMLMFIAIHFLYKWEEAKEKKDEADSNSAGVEVDEKRIQV
jgi:ACS family pantothenate transporter-like MFS transporter